MGGLLVFLSNYLIENRKKKKDELIEYRKELKKYMDDIIYPLYVIFDELFINLIGSVDVIADPPKIVEGTQLISSRKEIREAQIKIDKFLKEKAIKLDLIFPENLQSWKLIRLSVGINSIVEEIDKGENPVDKVNNLIAECIDFQKNIKILLGFKFDERLLITYLDEPHSRAVKRMVDKKTAVIAVLCVATVLFLGLWLNSAQEANRLKGGMRELEDDYEKLARVRTSLEENYSELRTEKEDLEKILETGEAITESAEWISDDERLKVTSELIITHELIVLDTYLDTYTVRVNITNIGDEPIDDICIFLFPYTNGEFTGKWPTMAYNSHRFENLYIGETYSHDFRISTETTSYKVLAVTG